MRRKAVHNLSIISSICVLSAAALTGCSIGTSKTVENVSDDNIKSQLLTSLNDNGYAVDNITEFTCERAEFSEEEKEALKTQFSSKATVHKYRCKFSSTSIERGIVGTYDLVFAYMNNEWSFISGSEYDVDNWIYSAKDVVSAKQIRDDLKTIDIAGLDGAKIGEESDTEIEISERQSDIQNGNDSMKVSVIYNAKFATYKFNIKLQYQFSNGKWQMTSNAVDDQDFWVIEFDETMKPNEPKEKYIIGELSNSSNYKNYMMNLSYVDNYYLTKEKETVNGNELSYNYVLIVTYDVFGDIEYDISKKYTWTDNAWQEGPLTVTVKSADWTKMIGTWASTNGDFLRVKDIEGNEVSGTYTHKYADGDYVTYSVVGEIDLELKDNDWDFLVEQGEITAGTEEEHFVILPFKVNLKDDTITSNGNIYVAKGDEDGGSGLHLEDGSYYEEKDDGDLTIEHNEDYDSGLHFFDSDEDETESSDETEDTENTESAEATDEDASETEDESEIEDDSAVEEE